MKNYHKIYGKNPVQMALNNPNRTHHAIFLTKSNLAFFEKKLKNLQVKNIKIVDNNFFSKQFPDVNTQNVLLESSFKKEPEIDSLFNFKNAKCLILDQITDIGNIGNIIRSAVAFGVKSIIVTEKQSPKDYGVIAKSSAGNCELLDIINVRNLVESIELLKKQNYWFVGLDGSAQISISQVNKKLFDGNSAIILGSEGKGMRRLTIDACDELAKIPMSESVESLNVASAAAIALYEFYGK